LKIESAYLLAGPETGKRAAFVAELRDAIAAKDGAPPEAHRLYASETGLGELLAILRNGSLFSSRRLVEYRGAEAVKGKEDLAALSEYIAAPAQDAVLVLTTELFYVERALEEAVGKERKRTFYEMFESEKPRWIKSRLSGFGLRIDEEGVAALLELVENESAALDSACARLAAVFPAGAEIGEAQVEAAIAHSRQEDAFTLFARVAAGELEDALEVLEAVLADRRGDAVQIISALTWSFRRLHRLGLLVEGGESFESACLRLQIRSKALQRQCSAALRRYSATERERIIRLASDFDGRARSLGSAFERGLLQLFVFGIMARKGELDLSPAPRGL
jgi:DNA polymerase III subunit delta